MANKKLTESDYEEIENMIKAGYKYRIIGKKFNVDESRIRQIKKQRNIETDFPTRCSTRIFKTDGTAYTKTEIDYICKLYTDGVGASAIAKQFDTGYQQIYRILKTRGIAIQYEINDELSKKICKLYNLGLGLTTIQRVLEVEGTTITMFKISECLRQNGIETRKYRPSRNIHLIHKVVSLKYEYGMKNKDIAIVVNRTPDRVRRILIEYKKTQAKT